MQISIILPSDWSEKVTVLQSRCRRPCMMPSPGGSAMMAPTWLDWNSVIKAVVDWEILTETQKEVFSGYKKDCQAASDIQKQCRQEFKEECHSVPGVKCVNLPKTVQETIHGEECFNEFDQECSTRYEQQCSPVMEKKCITGLRPSARLSMRGSWKCETVEDEVCEDVPSKQCRVVNEKKCSRVPKQ